MFKVSRENRRLIQQPSESSLIKPYNEECFEEILAKNSKSLKIRYVDSFKWERLFVSLYLKIIDKITEKVHEKFSLLQSFDLLIMMLEYINGIDIKQLGVWIAELDRSQLTREEENKLVDKKELKEILANPKKIAKYLNLLLYKSDFIFRLISLVNAPLTDPLLDSLYGGNIYFHTYYRNEEDFYDKYAFFNGLHFTNKVILWPVFLAILKNFSNQSSFSTICFSKFTNQEINGYIEKFLFNQYLIEINSETEIKNKINFLLENQTRLRDLVIACLENDEHKITGKVRDILAIKALYLDENEESLAFVFYAAVKALILSGRRSDLNRLFSAFKESGISSEILIGRKLYNLIVAESDRLDELYEDEGCNLRGLALENINPVGLLQQIDLSSENHVELLNWIWQHFFLILNEKERFILLKVALSTSKALDNNNVNLLNWYQKRLEELKEHVETGLDYQDIFINKIHIAWTCERDYGGGPYVGIFDYEKSKFIFNLKEENTATDLFHWLKSSFQNKKSFKFLEILFDLAIKSGEKNNFDSAFDNLVSFPDTEKVKNSYAFSRLMAVASIKNDKKILNVFWNKIINIEDKELQDGIKKRALVDSTWAFQQLIKEGNIELMDWILSRLHTLPEEGMLFHLAYKWNLLYGLDFLRFIKTKQGPVEAIVSAVISGKIEVLNKIYTEIAGLIEQLDKHDQTSERCESISAPMLKKWNPDLNLYPDREFDQDLDPRVRKATMLATLKQDYLEKKNFACLAYIPIFYNNKDYLHQINKNKFFTQEEKDKFITMAFKAAIECNNAEMLEIVWGQIEKNRLSIREQALFSAATKNPDFYFSRLFTGSLKFDNTIQRTNKFIKRRVKLDLDARDLPVFSTDTFNK